MAGVHFPNWQIFVSLNLPASSYIHLMQTDKDLLQKIRKDVVGGPCIVCIL